MTGEILGQQVESVNETSDDKLADPSHIPEEPTDYKKSQQATKDHPIKGHTKETKYHAFWSCLLPLFGYCLKWSTYVII